MVHWIILPLMVCAGSLMFCRFCQRLPLPPGPRGRLFLGIAKELLRTEYWKTYMAWGQEYGSEGLISFHILGRRIVVINSARAAEDLLNRRSLIYSDRPVTQMAVHLMKREKSMFSSPYNERVKMYRALMHRSFNASAVQTNYARTLEREARVLIHRLLRAPSQLAEHTKRTAATVTLKLAYGYTVGNGDDRFVNLGEDASKIASIVSTPGKWLVDTIPVLKYLPDCFPGTGFKNNAREWGQQLHAQLLEPLQFVKSEMAAGTAVPSFTSRLLSRYNDEPPNAECEDIILWTAGAFYFAGVETTASAMETFVLLMALYPDVQQRAQHEWDLLVSREHRLPIMRDRPSMPYTDCVLKEVLRWNPPAPLGVVHCTTVDDVYAGYHIPAKTPVVSNIWAMTHDPDTYPDPFIFDPERFTGTAPQRDPFDFVFGFGRRVCPGLHVAVSAMFVQMATILATVDVSKAVDSTGRIIEPEVAFTTAIVSHVKPFKYNIKPRSPHAESLIEQAFTSDE